MKPLLPLASAAAAATLLSSPLAAADLTLPGITVEATKLDKTSLTLSQSVTVVEAEEIERAAHTDVAEVLRSLAGIEFKQVGGPGQYTYLRMRGMGAGNVLVVVDGVTINQAGSGDVGHLLGQLDPSAIERIEVLRGPQTVLYGANATAGVISIRTKRGTEPALRAGVEAGALGWKKGHADWQHQQQLGEGQLGTRLRASKTDSDGVHKYEGFKDESFQLSADYRSEHFDAGLSLSQSDNRFNFAELVEVTRNGHPSYWASQLPDPHAYNDTRTRIASAWLEHYLSDSLSHRLELGWNDSRRKTRDRDNGLLGYVIVPWDDFSVDFVNFHAQGSAVPIYDNGSEGSAHYKDESTQLNYRLRYTGEQLQALIGAERLESSARQWGIYGALKGGADRDSIYANGEYRLGNSGLSLAAGLRHDDYDVWGNKTTGSLGATLALGNAVLFANHATSYRAPNLQELFNPNYGSTALKPENGRSSELGVRQHLAEYDLSWEATLWHTRIKDVVIYDASIANPSNPFGGFGRYANADQQRTRGLELSLNWALTPTWTLRGNYTYTDSHTRTRGADYARTVLIARHKANLGAHYHDGALSAGVQAHYSARRLDWTRRDWVDDYLRVDLSVGYALDRHTRLYARIENLFDERISEGLGYEQPGVYSVVGLEYRFF